MVVGWGSVWWWGGEVCGGVVGKCVVEWGGKCVVEWGGEVCGGGWGSVWWSGVGGEYLTLYTRVFEAVKVTCQRLVIDKKNNRSMATTQTLNLGRTVV